MTYHVPVRGWHLAAEHDEDTKQQEQNNAVYYQTKWGYFLFRLLFLSKWPDHLKACYFSDGSLVSFASHNNFGPGPLQVVLLALGLRLEWMEFGTEQVELVFSCN